MERIHSPAGAAISYVRFGTGLPLVLVHGAFSDHATNWEFVAPIFEKHYTVYAIARRGRGETDATEGHSLEDEGRDVAALIEAIGQPVFLLGHSYGAHASLLAAEQDPGSVRKLVLYEPAWPTALADALFDAIEERAAAQDWDGFATTFFRDGLSVPAAELDAMKDSPLWAPILSDAKATTHDLYAFRRYAFRPERFRKLPMPVLLQIGTESPRDLYVTDALAAVLHDVRIAELPGQAHEAMTTAPALYAEAVNRFLMS